MPEDGETAATYQNAETEEQRGICFDRVSVRLSRVIGKVKKDSLYSKDERARAEAEELIRKYDDFQQADRNYRVKAEQADRVRRVIGTLEAKGLDKTKEQKSDIQERWNRYHALRQEMAEFYKAPVDVNRLAGEFILYSTARTLQKCEEKYQKGLIKKDKAFEKKKTELKRDLEDDLAGYEKWSSNNIQSWGSRIGAFFGSFATLYTFVQAIGDTEVLGYKLRDIGTVTIAGISTFAFPAIDYVISKKKAAKQKAFKKDVERAEKALDADKIAMGDRLAEQEDVKIPAREYKRKKDVYQICFGNLDGFPEDVYEADVLHEREDHTPMETVRAKSTRDIKTEADNLAREAEGLFE